MPRPRPRIERHVPLPAPKPKDRIRRAHEDYVRSLGVCIACGKIGPVDVMHVRSGADGGMGLKPSSRFTVPGCHPCHMDQHQRGELTFWGELGIDPMDYCARLWAVSGDLEAGMRTILRARQAIELHRRSR